MKVKNLRKAMLHVLVLAGFSLLQGCATGDSPVCWLNWPYSTPKDEPLILPVDPIVGNNTMGGDDMYLPPLTPVTMPDTPVIEPMVVEPVKPAVPDHVYIVKKGDTLSAIASMYGTSWKKLADYNALSNPNKLFVKQEIRIPGTLSASTKVSRPRTPVSSSSTASVSAPTSRTAVSNPIAQGSSYVIQRGDTLSGIAKRAGLSVDEIKAANALDSHMIVAGKSLSIPKSGEVRVPAPRISPGASVGRPSTIPSFAPPEEIPEMDTPDPAPISAPAPLADIAPVDTEATAPVYDHVLYPGETLEDVARQYNTTVDEIVLLNGLTDPAAVKHGTKLLVPIPE